MITEIFIPRSLVKDLAKKVVELWKLAEEMNVLVVYIAFTSM